MARKKRTTQQKEVQDYRHGTATRKNNPPAGIAAQGTIQETPKQEYAYNPHLPPNLRSDPNGDADKLPELLQIAQQRPLNAEEAKTLADALRHHEPWLEWAGKQETKSFTIDPVALHIHERVSAKAILKVAERQNVQRELFADPQQDYSKAVDFYQHDVNWANRLILGDSLTVMSSLAHREDLAGKVQMIYIDPPYGIKFASNFQPTVFQRDVKDREQDLTREREQIKAYRDTWTLGVHSYLAYLRDRLIVAKDLLTDSGSIFVQIGDENVHRVRCVMDEVFGTENLIAQICYKTTSGRQAKRIDRLGNYILWFAKEIESVKYHNLFVDKDYNSEIQKGDLQSQGESKTRDYIVEFNGKKYYSRPGRHWATTEEGIYRLINANRVLATDNNITYKRLVTDYPVGSIPDVWTDLSGGASDKVYVVQTNGRIVERCLLMTTEPGDLVLDPTCVRKGTKVLTVTGMQPPLTPPQARGNNISAADAPAKKINEFSGKTTLSPKDSTNRISPSPACEDMRISSLSKAEQFPTACEDMRINRLSKVEQFPTACEDMRINRLSKVEQFPTACGGVRGGKPSKIPIETLRPGDWIISHTGTPRRVLRTIRKRYRGHLIGIQHNQSPTTLWVTADHYILCKQRTIYYGGDHAWSKVPNKHFGRARELRKEMTSAEKKLWQHLRSSQLGIKFRKQHPLGPYITDFYARDVGLVIEVDGDTHFTPDAKTYDAHRTDYLYQLGLTVLRFTNLEIFHQLEGVLERIQEAIDAVRSSKIPMQQWRKSDTLRTGDTVYFGIDRKPVEIADIAYIDTDEEVYDLEVEADHSYLTEVCAVHNCGSGTTAYVAEQWGRRWITIDTSRVAIALARQRLLTSSFDYYKFKDKSKGTAGGLLNKKVPHITLRSIAQNTALDPIFAKHEPILKEKLDVLNENLTQITPPHANSVPNFLLNLQQNRNGKESDLSQRQISGVGNFQKHAGRSGKCLSIPIPIGPNPYKTL